MKRTWRSHYKLWRRPLRVVPRYCLQERSNRVTLTTSQWNGQCDRRTLHSAVAELLSVEQVLSFNATENDLKEFRRGCECNDWEVILWCRNKEEGYTGLAFSAPSIGSVVIIHFLKCSEENLLLRYHMILRDDSEFGPMDLAATFVQRVIDIVKELKLDFDVVVTGHRLGGWLAQVTHLTGSHLTIKDNVFLHSLSDAKFPNLQCICFDPPGCLEEISNLKQLYCIESDELPLPTVYLTAPSLFNTLGHHWGHRYRILSQVNSLKCMYNPYDISIELLTTITRIKDIHESLKKTHSENILPVYQWPTICNLDFISSELIIIFGIVLLKEAANEVKSIKPMKKTFKLCGIAKTYNVGVELYQSEVDQMLLENVYVRVSNSKFSSITSAFGIETIKNFVMLDVVRKNLRCAWDTGRIFVLSAVAKGSKVHFKTYNTVYDCKITHYTLTNLLGFDACVVVIELHEGADGTCIAVLRSAFKADDGGVLMLSGLNRHFLDSLIEHQDSLTLNEVIISAAESDNQSSSTIVSQGSRVFENLCCSYHNNFIVWLHARGGEFIMKRLYDKSLRVKRKYGEHDIGYLLKNYDTIFIYGRPGCGKTNEIQYVMSEINSWVIYINVVELTMNDIDRIQQAVCEKNVLYLVKRFLTYHEDDEELITLLWETCLFNGNGSFEPRIVICFDGMDHLQSGDVNGELRTKQAMNNLLIHLKKSTSTQLIITSRRKNDYLRKLEEKMCHQFPLQRLWTGELEEMDECCIKNIINFDSVLISRSKTESCFNQLVPDYLFHLIRNAFSTSVPISSSSMTLEAGLACLCNATMVPDTATKFFEIIIWKKVKDVLMESNGEVFLDEENISSFICSLKKFVFHKFLSFDDRESKRYLSDQREEKLSFYNAECNCILEYLYAQTYVENIANMNIRGDAFSNCVTYRIMVWSEYEGARALLELLLPGGDSDNNSTERRPTDRLKKRALTKLKKENRVRLKIFFSHLFQHDQDKRGKSMFYVDSAEIGLDE